MSERAIADKLVNRGKTLFDAPEQPIQFTGNNEADTLLNDLDRYPHAFVLGCVMDRQVKSEKAWMIPHSISEKLGGFTMENLSQLSLENVIRLMSGLHRFPERMSQKFHSAVRLISNQYGGNAALIWLGGPSSAEVVYRFLEFDGISPKIANMAANTLARDFKLPFSDYFSIDISADVHVQHVFGRLGLCPANTSVERVIYKARSLHPRFPGMLDLPCWEIGKNWCNRRKRECGM